MQIEIQFKSFAAGFIVAGLIFVAIAAWYVK